MVVDVVERLLPSFKQLTGVGGEWRVHVIEGDDVNALVTPGGDIYVFTGILGICEDEEGLAVVLAHEMAHIVTRHFAERLSRLLILLPFLWVAVNILEPTNTGFLVLTDLTLLLPFGRMQESEADRVGLLVMAQSCFNPEAAVSFWGRITEMSPPGLRSANPPLELLSTHPLSYSRIKSIKEWLPEAKDKFHQSGCGTISNYARKIHGVFKAQGGMGKKREMVSQPPGQPQDDDDFL
jgi:metalloendopeptidase OMA1, mitochondrial